jgi:hypothetical protein
VANDKDFRVKNGILVGENASVVGTLEVPQVDFTNDTNTISAIMLSTDTLSFSGDSGQLFSITDSLSGTIFAVNDISGVPSIEVDDDGTIRFAETFGNVLIGTTTNDGTNKLQISGSASVSGDITVSGTVDGRDVAADGTKLDDLETALSDKLSTSGKAADSNLLDGIDSSGFKRVNDQTQVDVTLPASATGAWTNAISDNWGNPKFDTTFNKTALADSPATIQFNIPLDMKSAWISQLCWSSGGYVDIHGIQSGGELVFLRRINTRQSVENTDEGVNNDGPTVTFAASGLDDYTAIRFTVKSGRFHLTGLSFSSSDNEGTEGVGMVHPAQISLQGAESGLDADLLDGQHGSYYAPAVDAALTGTPTAPTAAAGTNTTQIATTAFTTTAIANLVDAAPGTLDTLNELAAALGDDKDFSATVATSIATKLSLAGGTLTGNLIINNADASITINDNSGDPADQGIRIRAESIDLNLPNSEGLGIIFEQSPSNASPDTTPAVITTGEFYSQSSQRVFHDSYHPNADTLTTARTINGVSFNGSANITVADASKLPLAGGTVTGNITIEGALHVPGGGNIATNEAFGTGALTSNLVGQRNVAIGVEALNSNLGSNNTAHGYRALYSNTTGASNVAIGQGALFSNTTGPNNTATGMSSLYVNTTGIANTANGYEALYSNTTGDNNVATGLQALYSNTEGNNNTAYGFQTLYNATGSSNTVVGYKAGELITTGSKNTIIGAYNGNQGGLDIRTASNFIVLSDGDGNPRQVIDASGNVGIGTTAPNAKLVVGGNGGVTSEGLVASFYNGNDTSVSIISNTNNIGAGPRLRLFENNSNKFGTELFYDSGLNSFSIVNYSNNVEVGRIHMLSNGRVGIGTSSPLSILHVGTGTDANLPITLATASGGNVEFRSNTATGSFTFTNANGASEKMRIDAAGNVGIGTSAPAGNLHIKSRDNSGDATLIIEADNDNDTETDNPRLEFRQDGNLVSASLYLEGVSGNTATGTIENSLVVDSKGSGNSQAIQFATGGRAAAQAGGELNSTVAMTILGSNGNVGIGTTAPTYKLEVNGSFAATTKSFVIPHPTKPNKKLRYGSLESPYHGVRLTGESSLVNGVAKVKLPEYIHGLCKQDGAQVQITNIRHGKVAWVEDIDVDNDEFTIRCDIELFDAKEYEFYWAFTAIRKDIEDMEVEID